MSVQRQNALLAAYAGDFASQQLAFAHLLDWADKVGRSIDLDFVEVIGRAQFQTRLAHYFSSDVVAGLIDAAGGSDTIVLVTDPEALPHASSAHLRFLGVHDGTLLRARPDTSC